MRLLERPGFLLLMRIAFWLALLFAITMALLPHPPQIVTDRLGDKLNHMGAFATLSVLAALAFPTANLVRLGERLSFVGALIEVAQALPILGRDCDIRDWFADTAAIIVALLFMHWLLQRWRVART